MSRKTNPKERTSSELPVSFPKKLLNNVPLDFKTAILSPIFSNAGYDVMWGLCIAIAFIMLGVPNQFCGFVLGIVFLLISVGFGVFVIKTKESRPEIRKVFYILGTPFYVILFITFILLSKPSANSFWQPAQSKQATPTLPTSIPPTISPLSEAISKLKNLKNEATILLEICGNENHRYQNSDYDNAKNVFQKNMTAFLNLDVIRKDDEFKHWTYPDGCCGTGTGFDHIDWYAFKKMKEAPPTTIQEGEYQTIQKWFVTVEYYLNELEIRKANEKMMCPMDWAQKSITNQKNANQINAETNRRKRLFDALMNECMVTGIPVDTDAAGLKFESCINEKLKKRNEHWTVKYDSHNMEYEFIDGGN